MFALLTLVMMAPPTSWDWPGYPDEGALSLYLMKKGYATKAELEEMTFREWRELHDKKQNENKAKGYTTKTIQPWNRGRACGNGACVMCYGAVRKTPAWDTKLKPIATMAPAMKPSEAPTPHKIVRDALWLARVGPDDRVCDIGCGDGRVLVAATKLGAKAIGIEKDRKQYERAVEAIGEAKGTATVVHGDATDIISLGNVSVVYMYLYPELMTKLQPKLDKLPKGARIVTYMHPLDGDPPDKTLIIQRGEDKHVLYLYER